MTTTLRTLAAMALAVSAGAACSTTQAVAPVERPALEVPPVPPRLVEPVAVTVAPTPELVPELPPPTPSASARAKPSGQPAKPDPKVEAPATPPAEPAATPSSAPQLRLPGTPDAEEATRRILEISGRAQAILNRTDYGPLSADRKSQYQHTQLLISQSNDAIKAANFEFARNLAEKAERLAKELQGR